MRIRSLLISAIFGTILCSCSNDITLTDHFDHNKPLTLTVYNRDNSTGLTTTKQSEIQPGTETYNQFIDWCNHNNEEWESSIASFAMGQFAITQNEFSLSYLIDGVVIHFKDKQGKSRQFTKSSKKEDFDFLVRE